MLEEMNKMELKNVIPTLEYSLPRVIETTSAVEKIEDWSKVRSPARAKRRMKNGHRQNIRIYNKPASYLDKSTNTLYIHPRLVEELSRKITDAMNRTMDRMYSSALFSR